MQSPNPTASPLDHLPRCGAPDAAALIMRDEIISYAALELMVGQMAAALVDMGLAPGDRVATWLPKTRLACIMPLAAARAGLVHVPVNPMLKHAQVAHILADSGAHLLVTADTRAKMLADADVPAACRVVLDTEMEALSATLTPRQASAADVDALAAILYTSGSTGRPKGVMLSHANLWLGAISVAHYLRLGAGDRVLGVLPLSFDYGQNQLFSTWAAGGAVIPLDYLTARDVVKAVERHDVTSLAGVPPLWTQLCETEWPPETAARLRRLTNSGGALSVPLVNRLTALFPNAALFPMYGLTEAFRSTYLDPTLVAAHPTSMGKAIPFAEVMVVRADGAQAGVGESGELVHAGPLVAQGYWQDAARTALRFKPAPIWSQYGGMAVWSGDKVRRDAEGLLYFVGRDDEMIKCAGNRISPTEIEDVAIASGLTNEAVALGVEDERLGQAVLLIARGDGTHAKALEQYFRRELPAFMQPQRVVWCEGLPRNPNGKLDRAAIRSATLEGAA